MASIHSMADNKAASEACLEAAKDEHGLALCYVGLEGEGNNDEDYIDWSCADDCDRECKSDENCLDDCGQDIIEFVCGYCYVSREAPTRSHSLENH